MKLFSLEPIRDHHEWNINSSGDVDDIQDIIYQFNGGFVSEKDGKRLLWKTKKAEELDIMDIRNIFDYQGTDYWRDWGIIGVYDINSSMKPTFVGDLDELQELLKQVNL